MKPTRLTTRTIAGLWLCAILTLGCGQRQGQVPQATAVTAPSAVLLLTTAVPSTTPTATRTPTPTAAPRTTPTPMPGPTPTPDFASRAFTVDQSVTSSPDGLWTATVLTALPMNATGRTGPDYYTQLTVARADGAVAWPGIAKWAYYGIGYDTLRPLHWSRDGRFLYFTFWGHGDCPHFENGSNLLRLDLQYGRVTEVAPALGDALALSPDEATLAAAQHGRLVLRDLATGQERRATLPTGKGYSPAGAILWRPDGGALVLAVATGICGARDPEGRAHTILCVDPATLTYRTLIERDNRMLVPQDWPEPGRVLLVDKDKARWWMDADTGELARAQ